MLENYQLRLQKIHELLGILPQYRANTTLPIQSEALMLEYIGKDQFNRPQYLIPAAAQAWHAMREDAISAGVSLWVVSAFRSVEQQKNILKRKLNQGQLMEDILKINAAPGFSEHHSGRTLDLNTPECEPLNENFDQTSAYQWLNSHAGRFHFNLSYPKGNAAGIIYEPWHWTYRDP